MIFQMRSNRTTNHSQTSSLRNARPRPRSATPSSQSVNFHPPKHLTRASTTFYNRIITDWWWWELFSWLVSFVCFMAIVGILLCYDGKKQPSHVVKGITLNAFIAVFSAIAKAAMIVPVSESIGQLKWVWFKEEKRLSDFLAFDNASRGPWGSLLLLGTTMCRRLVSVGAAITVLALAFEPFFQQSVSFPTRNVVTNISTVSVASSYHPINDIAYMVDADFQWNGVNTGNAVRSAAINVMNALSTRDDEVRAAPSFCPTSQCTWPKYSSLGVCHKCQDLSHLLVHVCQKDALAFPNGGNNVARNPCGYQFNGTFVTGTDENFGFDQTVLGLSTMIVGDRIALKSGVIYSNSTVFQRASNALLDFYVAYTPGGDPGVLRNATPIMMECLFQWCVKTMQGSYQNGRLQETVLSTYLAPDITAAPTRLLTATLGSDPNEEFVMVAEGKTFAVAANVTRRLSNSLRANLPVMVFNDSLDTTGQYPGRWNFVQNAPYDLNAVLDSMAEAMTNDMRTGSANNGTTSVHGDAWATEAFVSTQWLWLLLPGSLLVSSLVLICATIVESRRKGVTSWKSSALATLLHGLTEELSASVTSGALQSEVEAMSQKLKVKLLPGLQGDRLTPVNARVGGP